MNESINKYSNSSRVFDIKFMSDKITIELVQHNFTVKPALKKIPTLK